MFVKTSLPVKFLKSVFKLQPNIFIRMSDRQTDRKVVQLDMITNRQTDRWTDTIEAGGQTFLNRHLGHS